jgi:hypothetical protein
METTINQGIDYAQRYLEALESLVPQFTMFGLVGIAVGVVIALLFTFFGYRLIRFLLAAVGFIVGLTLGGSIAIRLDLEDKLIVIISLVAAVLFAFVAGFIYKLGLFIVFTAAGWYLAGMLLAAFYTGPYSRWIAVGAALITGILSAWLGKVCIIVLSSLAGGLAVSNLLVGSVLTQVAQFNSERITVIITLVFGLVLAACAMRYQFTTSEGK